MLITHYIILHQLLLQQSLEDYGKAVVIFGVHWGVTPMCLANYDLYGMDTFQAFQTMAVIAQTGAALGVFIKAKKYGNKKFSFISWNYRIIWNY